MSIRPDLPDAIKTIILKTLLEHSFVSETDQARLEAGFDGPAHISISIEQYAAGPGHRTAVEPPPKVGIPVLDAIASDRKVSSHRNSPPAPELALEKYQAFDVVDGVAKPATIDGNRTATSDEPVVIIDSVGNTYTVKRRNV
jgi:hypothetical protein